MAQLWDTIIVGGGLAGYVAANFLARTDRSILMVEGGEKIGGRARTDKISGQYFNIGPHALYKKGKVISILEQLGIKLHGSAPKLGGALIENQKEYAAPFTPLGVLTTRLMNGKERMEWIAVIARINRADTDKLARQTFEQWVQQTTKSDVVAKTLYALGRLATYCHAPDQASAKIMVSQLKSVMKGVLYIDGGWQMMIDQLHNQVIVSGVEVRTGTVVKQIRQAPTNEHLILRLASGEEWNAKHVICTTGPRELTNMLGDQLDKKQRSFFDQITAVRGATLDVALTHLPNPRRTFALGLSEPLYYSVHSEAARLSDDGKSAVLHVFKYLRPDESVDSKQVKAELEQFLEQQQPGWRDHVIASRYFPHITVNQRLPQVDDEHMLHGSITGIPGLFVAGDWASPDSILSDGAASSGKKAAEEVINHESGVR